MEKFETYQEAALFGQGNLLVRQNNIVPEKDRILLLQFSSNILYHTHDKDISDTYYDTLYSGTRKGYERLADFWELPYWTLFASAGFPFADLYIVRSLPEAKEFLASCSYKQIACSVLGINLPLVQELSRICSGRLAVGGYVEPETLFKGDVGEMEWYASIQDWTLKYGTPSNGMLSYRHYIGTQSILRLTMSDGCLHHCSFCTVPHRLKERPLQQIEAQVHQIAKKMHPKLVYLDDKTFGQANNYQELERLGGILAQDPQFLGFIIQTSASQLIRLDDEWLQRSRIRYVELGVETYNDTILRKLHKPASERLLDQAASKLENCGISFIPNIIIGIPNETEESYRRTLQWLESRRRNISHINCYSLALYPETELGQEMAATVPSDLQENSPSKSYYSDPAPHLWAYQKAFEFGLKCLSR